MLRVRDDRLTWDERDVVAMVEVLGADAAATQWSPPLASVIKSAKRHGVRIGRSAGAVLRRTREDIAALRAQTRASDAPPCTPVLRAGWPHQRADVAAMHSSQRDAFLLGHSVGVGKTLEAIGFANVKACRRVLVVCPNTAKYQWRRETVRWHKRSAVRVPRVSVLDGTVAAQVATASRADGWVIAHWEALAHAAKGLLARPWDLIIADEAHNVANRNTVRAQTLLKLRSRYRLAATAHPYTNRPDEIWTILSFLYPGVYRSFWRFFHQHVRAVPKPFGGFDVLGTRDQALLRFELAPFTLRRTNTSLGRTDVTRVVRTVTLSAVARKEYDRLRKQLFVELEGHGDTRNVLLIPNVLSRTTRVRQYLVDPALIKSSTPSLKYPVVRELLDELDAPPVIFTSFTQAANRLAAYLHKNGKRTALITGDVSARAREHHRQRFLRGKLDALIVQVSAGGEALNLGKYGYVIDLDLPWHPRALEQTEGRVNRPQEGTGTITPTTVIHIVVEDSYEQKQIARLERKHRTFSEVFNPTALRALFT